MADSINVQFGALHALAFDLANAGPAATRQADRALRKSARDVESISSQLVPIDTGATKNSIGTDQAGNLHYVVGPTTEYAPWLELGTSTMGPHAFMGPAGDRVAPQLTDAMLQLGGDVLR